jgi:hypothetical protein
LRDKPENHVVLTNFSIPTGPAYAEWVYKIGVWSEARVNTKIATLARFIAISINQNQRIV